MSSDNKQPNAYRPLYIEYKIVGNILQEYDVYAMSRLKFIAECVSNSNGAIHPVRAKIIYNQLMGEAGL